MFHTGRNQRSFGTQIDQISSKQGKDQLNFKYKATSQQQEKQNEQPTMSKEKDQLFQELQQFTKIISSRKKFYAQLHEIDFKQLEIKMLEKKESMIKEIHAKYLALHEHLNLSQISLYEDIAKEYKNIYQQMTDLGYSKEFKQEINYKNWEENLFKLFKTILLSPSFDLKNILWEDVEKSNKGSEYLKQFEGKIKERVKSLDQRIETIGIQFADNIQSLIYNFAHLTKRMAQQSTELIFQSTSPLKDYLKPRSVRDSIIVQDNKSNRFSSFKIKVVEANKLHDSCEVIIERSSDLGPSTASNLHHSTTGYKHRKRLIMSKSVADLSSSIGTGESGQSQNQQSSLVLYEKIKKSVQNFSDQNQTGNIDLSNSRITDQQLYTLLSQARKKKKINCLKLSKNLLTNAGILKCLPFLDEVNNINLSANKITEDLIDILITNRKRLSKLKIVDVTQNKMNERAVQHKLEELKRIGIFIRI